MKQNYRNAKFDKQGKVYYLPSVSDITFSTCKKNLEVSLLWDNLPQHLEKVCVVLNNNKLIRNVFVVEGNLFYYLNDKLLFDRYDLREEYMQHPDENIMEYYCFEAENIVCIYSDNIPHNPWFNLIGYWYKYLGHDPLDTKCALRYNMVSSLENIKYPINLNKSEILYLNQEINIDKIYINFA